MSVIAQSVGGDVLRLPVNVIAICWTTQLAADECISAGASSIQVVENSRDIEKRARACVRAYVCAPYTEQVFARCVCVCETQ